MRASTLRAVRALFAHTFKTLMIFIANSRTSLAHAQTVDTRPFAPKLTWDMAKLLLTKAILDSISAEIFMLLKMEFSLP